MASDSELELENSIHGAARALSECGENEGEAHLRGESGLEALRNVMNSLSLGNEDMDRGSAQSSTSEDETYLPSCVIRMVAELVASETNAAMLSLLAMCGTCKQWRGVASELNGNASLAFDGFDNVFSTQTSVQKFRKLPSAEKEKVFAAAALLFTGYTDVSCSGDGNTDLVLSNMSKQVGSKLVRVKISSSSSVTDVGLHSLLCKTMVVEHLHLEDLPKAMSGLFLRDVFEQCASLQSVHLSSMPSLSWSSCKISSALWPVLGLKKLHVRGVNLDHEFGLILQKMPNLAELEIDGPARNITSASVSCLALQRVSYQVASRQHLDESLAALVKLPMLKTLELIVKNFTLCSEQLSVIGRLPLVELRLDSYIYKQQPTLSRSSYSHVDNDGVKALVDSICNRWCAMSSDMHPLKLSLCGATALTHDAVSALLRLPVLTELDIGGCCRIIAMDKMRLVAKVRAGREMLESGRKPRGSRFPGIFH